EEDRLADIPPGGGNAGGAGGRSKASNPGAFDLGRGGGAGGASSYTPPTVYVEPADDTNPLDIPRPPVYSSKAEEIRIGHLEHFNMGSILRVRAAAEKLVDELDEYYGGKDRAAAMLAGSWQAPWMLGEDFEFLDEEGMRGHGPDEDDDDDDSVEDDDDADDDGRRRMQRHPGEGRRLDKAKRAEKKAKKAAAKLAELDANHTAAKKRKKKGAKEGKVLVDPDGMDEDELAAHHHRRKQRTTKLVTTVARALLNPLQDKFVIGTIGSSVAAGHDNCHYDSYESQLERTLFPVFAAGSMSLVVQNAGEGGGCGDDHKNQVFCITHDVRRLSNSMCSPQRISCPKTKPTRRKISPQPGRGHNPLQLDVLREGNAGGPARAADTVGADDAEAAHGPPPRGAGEEQHVRGGQRGERRARRALRAVRVQRVLHPDRPVRRRARLRRGVGGGDQPVRVAVPG
ncbi:hypothetical protein THAOC_33070, partial [Thalassiosira oceanica]